MHILIFSLLFISYLSCDAMGQLTVGTQDSSLEMTLETSKKILANITSGSISVEQLKTCFEKKIIKKTFKRLAEIEFQPEQKPRLESLKKHLESRRTRAFELNATGKLKTRGYKQFESALVEAIQWIDQTMASLSP